MLGVTEFLSPNTERRERSTAGSLTVKPAISLVWGLPVRQSTLTYGPWLSTEYTSEWRVSREATRRGGRKIPPMTLDVISRRAMRP